MEMMICSILRHLSTMAVLWHGHAWLPVELGHWCLLMMTADGRSWILSEVYKYMACAQIQPNSDKLVGQQHFNTYC